jgi:hypothetical protein
MIARFQDGKQHGLNATGVSHRHRIETTIPTPSAKPILRDPAAQPVRRLTIRHRAAIDAGTCAQMMITRRQCRQGRLGAMAATIERRCVRQVCTANLFHDRFRLAARAMALACATVRMLRQRLVL